MLTVDSQPPNAVITAKTIWESQGRSLSDAWAHFHLEKNSLLLVAHIFSLKIKRRFIAVRDTVFTQIKCKRELISQKIPCINQVFLFSVFYCFEIWDGADTGGAAPCTGLFLEMVINLPIHTQGHCPPAPITPETATHGFPLLPLPPNGPWYFTMWPLWWGVPLPLGICEYNKLSLHWQSPPDLMALPYLSNNKPIF